MDLSGAARQCITHHKKASRNACYLTTSGHFLYYNYHYGGGTIFFPTFTTFSPTTHQAPTPDNKDIVP